MSRHTLGDGITPDVRIHRDLYHLHLPVFAPSIQLLGDYYKRDLGWRLFAQRYRAEMRELEKIGSVANLARLALRRDVTIMCIEQTAEECHRRLLAEECQRYERGLRVEHR